MRVLLVEDNIADIIIVQEAFEELGSGYQLDFVKEGSSVLDRVKDSVGTKTSKRYELILLDINIPAPNGREILKQLKGDSIHASIPVVILTTSNDERDIDFAYRHQVNAFVTKPSEIDDFLETIKKVVHFWNYC
ncbi:response regulator [Flagellimonas halotolerans]|uniref:Response regulator n=1 Tax=Flagellimonas halotolerans TaxID=3112164 RepID=A0ABU6ISW8_9FLAO|nr:MULTISPECIES: response regulator [unclassified Allomuricauda]MEC3966220.1 response regulator [Muricauda sp. SYSU M86414]MEC4266094.1 response regulator [Muricauda sp. SYSU M84420]